MNRGPCAASTSGRSSAQTYENHSSSPFNGHARCRLRQPPATNTQSSVLPQAIPGSWMGEKHHSTHRAQLSTCFASSNEARTLPQRNGGLRELTHLQRVLCSNSKDLVAATQLGAAALAPAYAQRGSAQPQYRPHRRRSAHVRDAQRAQAVLEGRTLEELVNTSVRFQDLERPAEEDVCREDDSTLALEDICCRDVLFSGSEAHRAPLHVAVLLSGGVDSSLALHLLQQAGHCVTAFYLQIWFQEDFANFWDACPWEEDLEVCKQVCEQAGVPLQVVPLTEHYWQRVVAHSIDEIRSGRTPNPDVLCNSRVKFGAFYEFLETHHASDFDRVASGHYARILRDLEDPEQPVQLALTPDAVKDQTYFLAHLTQQQLSRVMFPLGGLTKAEVRRLAVAAQLPNQARRDSQGICFLGKVKFDQFVKEHLGTWPGPLVEEESGEVVGFHEGFWFYTPGQRKGIFLSGGPWYVSRKDVLHNVVFISRQYHAPDKQRNAFRCGRFNWVAGHGLAQDGMQRLQCKVRHGPEMYSCVFEMESGGEAARVALDGCDQGLAPGQFAVFYLDGVCLGSATILEALSSEADAADSKVLCSER